MTNIPDDIMAKAREAVSEWSGCFGLPEDSILHRNIIESIASALLSERTAQETEIARLTKELAEVIKLSERLAASEARVAELEKALKDIADGKGVCGTCGTPTVGDNYGHTACDCRFPVWTPVDPVSIARAALIPAKENINATSK